MRLAQEVLGSIPEPIKSDTESSPLQRFRVAQALSRGDGPHHSLHASTFQYYEYDEGLIFLLDVGLVLSSSVSF